MRGDCQWLQTDVYCPLPGLVVCPGETSGAGGIVPGVSVTAPPLLEPEEDEPELLGPGLLVSLCILEPAGEDVVLSDAPLVPEAVPPPVVPAQAPSSSTEQVKGIVHFIIDCSRKKNK